MRPGDFLLNPPTWQGFNLKNINNMIEFKWFSVNKKYIYVKLITKYHHLY